MSGDVAPSSNASSPSLDAPRNTPERFDNTAREACDDEVGHVELCVAPRYAPIPPPPPLTMNRAEWRPCPGGRNRVDRVRQALSLTLTVPIAAPLQGGRQPDDSGNARRASHLWLSCTLLFEDGQCLKPCSPQRIRIGDHSKSTKSSDPLGGQFVFAGACKCQVSVPVVHR
jgi:hypothetical protein